MRKGKRERELLVQRQNIGKVEGGSVRRDAGVGIDALPLVEAVIEIAQAPDRGTRQKGVVAEKRFAPAEAALADDVDRPAHRIRRHFRRGNLRDL